MNLIHRLRARRIGFTSFLINIIFLISISGAPLVISAANSCGIIEPDFKYFAVLEGVDETLEVGKLIPRTFETFNISNFNITFSNSTSLTDEEYIKPELEDIANSNTNNDVRTTTDNIRLLRFRLARTLKEYLKTASSSILQFDYKLTCNDGSEVTGSLLLDVQDINNIEPKFELIDSSGKYFIDWKSYQKDPEAFKYKLTPMFDIYDNDYLPSNSKVNLTSCLIEDEFDCLELLSSLEFNESSSQNRVGTTYSASFRLKREFGEFLASNFANESIISLQLTAFDGVNESVQEFIFEFVGRASSSSGSSSEDPEKAFEMPLGLILGISISSFILIVFLIFALLKSIIRTRKQARNIEKLTEADIREFREGTSILSSSSVGTHRDSIVANAPVLSKPYNNQFEISRENLKIDETTTLGVGMFGTVMRGYVTLYDSTQYPVAVKTVKKNAGVLYFKSLLTELKIMSFIGKHQNIVCLVGACTQNIRKRELFVAVELCSNGNFRNYLKDRRDFYENLLDDHGKLNIRRNSLQSLQNGTFIKKNVGYNNITTIDLLRWSFQVANGMEFIASKNVIHGDLAARNILLDDNLVAKIADFGLSRRLIDYTNYNYTKKSQCPLPWKYMAIESLKDLQFSLKTDIWTFGVLLWEIFTLGQKPFSTYTEYDEKFIAKLEGGLRLDPPKFAPKEICSLMSECWATDPMDRPTFYHVKKRISGLLHSQGDYADLVEDSIYNNNYYSPRHTLTEPGYGVIHRQPIYDRIISLPSPKLPPTILERPDDAFIY